MFTFEHFSFHIICLGLDFLFTQVNLKGVFEFSFLNLPNHRNSITLTLYFQYFQFYYSILPLKLFQNTKDWFADNGKKNFGYPPRFSLFAHGSLLIFKELFVYSAFLKTITSAYTATGQKAITFWIWLLDTYISRRKSIKLSTKIKSVIIWILLFVYPWNTAK